jgi:hypothetical protein
MLDLVCMQRLAAYCKQAYVGKWSARARDQSKVRVHLPQSYRYVYRPSLPSQVTLPTSTTHTSLIFGYSSSVSQRNGADSAQDWHSNR